MATNPPDDQIILVRGSAAHKDYMRHHFGWLKSIVNGLEDGLSISGRSLLLIFILYTTVKAGLTISGRDLPWWVDTIMLAFQVCGLEGAIPGLSRLREVLLAKNQPAATEDAETVRKAILSARWLNMLTGVEILLAAYSATQPNLFGLPINIAEISKFYGYALLLLRLWKITSFIAAMARMETRKPRIISQEEHDKQQQEAEQAQIRLDNAAIQASIRQELNAWTKSQQQQQHIDRQNMQALIDETLGHWTALQSQNLASQFEAQQQQVAVMQAAKQTPELTIDALTEAIFASLSQHFESKIEAVRQQSEALARQQTEAMKRFVQGTEAKIAAQTEAPRRSSEAPRRSNEKSTEPRIEVATKPSGPSLLRLPANNDRAAQKAEVFRLIDEEHLSTYKVAEQTKIPAGTIQRWLSERKAALSQAPGDAKEA